MTDFASFQVIIFYESGFLLPLKQKIIMDPIFLWPQIPLEHNMPQHGLPVKDGRVLFIVSSFPLAATLHLANEYWIDLDFTTELQDVSTCGG